MMGMLIKVMQFLRRLSPLAPWRVLRTLDEVRELPVLRTQVKQGLTETKKLKKQMLEVQRRLDQRKELAALLTRVEQFQQEFPTHSPLWVPEDEVEVVREVPGRSNSAVVSLNSTGAHRASIPADAPPETDRYIYQVQLAARGRTPRCTEIGDAPGEQGEKREHTGSMRPMNNAAQRDAAPIECSGAFATGC